MQVLAKQQGWLELADHLDDITPAARDAAWRGLAEQAALGVLAIPGDAGLARGEALLARYPSLTQSKQFVARRAELGLAAFARCFDNRKWTDRCLALIPAFVAADPTNDELAFKLGKLLPPIAARWHAVAAFAVAIRKKDDARCKDASVTAAIVSGLGRSASEQPDVVKAAIELGGALCWTASRDAIVDALAGDGTDILKNACPIVKDRVTLSSLMTKRCATATQP